MGSGTCVNTTTTLSTSPIPHADVAEEFHSLREPNIRALPRDTGDNTFVEIEPFGGNLNTNSIGNKSSK